MCADGDIEVTELPIRKWTQDYKEMLDGMMKPEGKDNKTFVSEFRFVPHC